MSTLPCRYPRGSAHAHFSSIDPSSAESQWRSEEESVDSDSSDATTTHKYTGRACPQRVVAKPPPVSKGNCGDPVIRFSTILSLAAANQPANPDGPKMVRTRRTDYLLTTTPDLIANFIIDGGLWALTWAGLVLGRKSLGETIGSIMGDWHSFLAACQEIAKKAGEIQVFRPYELGAVDDVPHLEAGSAIATAVSHNYKPHFDGYYVNFAAPELGGGVVNLDYMSKTARGWAMEESFTFLLNLMPWLFETKDGHTYATSNLLTGLGDCPVVLRVNCLFDLPPDLMWGVGGKLRLVQAYAKGMVRSKTVEMRIGGDQRTRPGLPIYWVCMASPNFTEMKGQGVEAVTRMFNTAKDAFAQCYKIWKGGRTKRIEDRGGATSDVLTINTGRWGAGFFGIRLYVSVAVQYLAALAVHVEIGARLQLVFHVSGKSGAVKVAVESLIHDNLSHLMSGVDGFAPSLRALGEAQNGSLPISAQRGEIVVVRGSVTKEDPLF